MESVNNLLNRIDAWGQNFNPETNENQGVFKRVVATRLATVFVGTFLDIAAVAKEAFIAICVPTKMAIHKFKQLSGSDYLDTFESKLPTTRNFFATVYRVFAFTIGAISSATVGLISPSDNFKLHCELLVASNYNEEEQEFSALMQELAFERKAKELLNQTKDICHTQVEKIKNEVVKIEEASKEASETTAIESCIILDDIAKEVHNVAEDAATEKAAQEQATEIIEHNNIIETKNSELETATPLATAQEEDITPIIVAA